MSGPNHCHNDAEPYPIMVMLLLGLRDIGSEEERAMSETYSLEFYRRRVYPRALFWP